MALYCVCYPNTITTGIVLVQSDYTTSFFYILLLFFISSVCLLHAAALLMPSCSKWSSRDLFEEQCVRRGRICFWNEVDEAPGLTQNRCAPQSFVVGFSLTSQSATLPSYLHQCSFDGFVSKQTNRRLKTRYDYQDNKCKSVSLVTSCLFCLLFFWPN